LLAVSTTAAAAADIPRFQTLSHDKVYMRQGPSYKHRIIWVYQRKGLPVEILSVYDIWRRVRAPDGTVGWIQNSMLSNRPGVVVTSAKRAPIRAEENLKSKVLALADKGVVASLKGCARWACKIEVQGVTGWIARAAVWDPRAANNEIIKPK
jgi:SH3-like domain-containing protein